MSADRRRDDEHVRRGLTAWLRSQRPTFESPELGPIHRPAVGFSNETIFAQLRYASAGTPHEQELVLRLPPPGPGVFPEYDLVKQGRLQAALAATALSVVAPIGVEGDESWLGSPFILMPRIEGRVLSNDPSFLTGSWLDHEEPQAQRRVFDSFVSSLAEIHTLPWEELGLGFLSEQPGLVTELDRWESYANWAADGSPPGEIVDAYAWCRANRPDPEPEPTLVWGDPGFSNVLIGGSMDIVALLDWELATIAPPQLDLSWFSVFHSDAVIQAGTNLLGFPDTDHALDGYESFGGQPIGDSRWFDVFALARGASCLVRIQRLYLAQGMGPEEGVLRHPGFRDRIHALIG